MYHVNTVTKEVGGSKYTAIPFSPIRGVVSLFSLSLSLSLSSSFPWSWCDDGKTQASPASFFPWLHIVLYGVLRDQRKGTGAFFFFFFISLICAIMVAMYNLSTAPLWYKDGLQCFPAL
ncbi:MAG: hypothetical protein J3Q66DRAFT_3524 [Benniella sp.]|nr:MAG: hypothetical protein J3Q66DRAFT_3524 [Benniella sp.]